LIERSRRRFVAHWDLRGALDDANAAIKVGRASDRTWAYRGSLYSQSAPKKALSDLRKAVALNPKMHQYSLGKVAWRLGRHEEALAAFDADALARRDLFVASERALLLVDMGELDRALEALRAVRRKDPAYPYAAVKLAGLLTFQANRPGAAVTMLSKFIAATEDPAWTALYHRGVAQRRRSKYTEALADFDLALTQEPSASRIQGERGLCHAALGNLEEASTALDAYFELGVDWPFGERIRARVVEGGEPQDVARAIRDILKF